MPPQQMAEAGQSVGGALDGAGQFEDGKRHRHVEAASEHACSDIAFARVRGVLGVDEANDGGQRVLGVGAASLRNFGRGGKARGCGFGPVMATSHNSASVEQRPGSISAGTSEAMKAACSSSSIASSTRSTSCSMIGAGVEAAGFACGLRSAMRSAFCSIRPARAARRLPSARTACLQRGDMVGDGGGDVVRQSDLTHDDRKQRAVDALQTPDQVGFDLIADQSTGSPCA